MPEESSIVVERQNQQEAVDLIQSGKTKRRKREKTGGTENI